MQSLFWWAPYSICSIGPIGQMGGCQSNLFIFVWSYFLSVQGTMGDIIICPSHQSACVTYAGPNQAAQSAQSVWICAQFMDGHVCGTILPKLLLYVIYTHMCSTQRHMDYLHLQSLSLKANLVSCTFHIALLQHDVGRCTNAFKFFVTQNIHFFSCLNKHQNYAVFIFFNHFKVICCFYTRIRCVYENSCF